MRITHLKIDEAEVLKFVRERNGPIMKDIDRRATRVQTVMRAYVRVRTGLLLSTIRKKRSYARGSVTILVGNREVDYAAYENYGTRPHIITPKNRQYLRFVARDGRVVFTKKVRHPGTTGSFFIDRSMIYAAG
jgi:hypothetical protein